MTNGPVTTVLPGDWRMIAGSSQYSERVYPNHKVGHVLQAGLWRASLDGIGCGTATLKEDAMLLVDLEYKERYG